MRQTGRRTRPADIGFGAALPGLGAVQRAGLGRGLAFVLTLTLAGLALVYGPLVLGSGDADRPDPALRPLSVQMLRFPLAERGPAALPR